MTELKAELFAAPEDDWRHVPFVVNRHKWWLRWYRGDDGKFVFAFASPKKRYYTFFAERGKNGGRVFDADITTASGDTIASYCEVWGDKPERMDAVIRLTPKHIIDRLFVLLDAIG